MKKKNQYMAICLEIAIISITLLLGLTPLFKDNKKEEIIDISNKEKENNNDSFSSNIAFIEMGINSYIDGEGAIIKNNNINIIEGGTYNLTGNLKEASIYINTEDKVVLNFNNINIMTTGEALVIENAKEVIINLPLGSDNVIMDGDNNPYPGSIYSKVPLIFKGEGGLRVYGNKMSISALEGYEILGGELVFLGNNDIVKPLDNSKQNSIITNINNLPINKGISLIKDNSDNIIDFSSNNNYNNILISSKLLISGSYNMVNNETNENINLTPFQIK